MATSNKIEHDIKSDALDCALINKLGTDINSIDESQIKNPIKIPAYTKPTNFFDMVLELERSLFNKND